MARNTDLTPREDDAHASPEVPEDEKTPEDASVSDEAQKAEAAAAEAGLQTEETEEPQVEVVYTGEGENPKVSVPGHSEVELPATVDATLAAALVTGADVEVKE